jgi:hypothetical protein
MSVLLQETIDKIKRNHGSVRRVFNTEDGKALLDFMVEMFMKQPLFDKDPVIMAYKVGQHDLMQLIVDIKESKPNE